MLPASMLTLAQRRHWLATSPLEFQRRANVGPTQAYCWITMDIQGNQFIFKFSFLHVFYISWISMRYSHTNRITCWTDVIFDQRWAKVGPMDKMTLAQRNDIRWANVGPTSEC